MDLIALQVDENNEDTENEDGSTSEVFDIRLPVTHQYLQSNSLGEISAGAIFVDPGCEICVPVLLMDAVLLPGQTLPLQFQEPECVEFVRNAAEKKQYFALISSLQDQDTVMDDMNDELTHSETGTLFQVQNASSCDSKLTLQAVGRQRCRLVNKLQYVDLQCQDFTVNCYKNVKVLVLEDIVLPPIISLPGYSLNRLPEKNKMKYFAMLTAHSAYSLQQSTTESVVFWLRNWLQKWFDLSRINIIINQGYTIFSYFVASNLPVALEEKVKFLKEDCTDRRLRMQWSIVCQMHFLACNMCKDIKCELNDLINLSVEANGTHFVNPSGFVHDLFTVNRISNVRFRGMPSAEFSWFPGYAWTTLECNSCSNHLGWRFTSRKLQPKRFYGISRKSIQLSQPEETNSP